MEPGETRDRRLRLAALRFGDSRGLTVADFSELCDRLCFNSFGNVPHLGLQPVCPQGFDPFGASRQGRGEKACRAIQAQGLLCSRRGPGGPGGQVELEYNIRFLCARTEYMQEWELRVLGFDILDQSAHQPAHATAVSPKEMENFKKDSTELRIHL